MSLDQMENSLTEMNADYEVNDRVFFGTYDEYYTNIECAFFDNTQFSTFSKKFNEKYICYPICFYNVIITSTKNGLLF